MTAAAGCQQAHVAPGLADDIPNPVPALEMEAAQASYWAASDGSDFDGVAIDAALSGKAPADPTLAPDSRVGKLARCMIMARRTGQDEKPEQPVMPLEAGVASSAFVLDFGDEIIECRLGQRTLCGRQTVRTIDNTGGGNLRTLEVAALGREVLASPVWEATTTDGSQDRPGYTLGVPTELAAGSRSLRLSIDITRVRTQVATGDTLTMQVRAQDSNSLVVDQTLFTVDDTFLRLDYGSSTAASARTIVSGQVEVDVEAQGLETSHAFENVAFNFAQSCNCPASGVLRQAVRYGSGRVAKNIYTFTGCGRADVTSTASEQDGRVSAQVGVALWTNCY